MQTNMEKIRELLTKAENAYKVRDLEGAKFFIELANAYMQLEFMRKST